LKFVMLTALFFAGYGCSEPAPTPAPAPSPTTAQEAAPAAPAPAAPAPAADKQASSQRQHCPVVFSDDIANQTFKLLGGTAPEGCKFEGLSTEHSKMTVRWETPPFQAEDDKKNIVDFTVVPTECAKEFGVEPSGSLLSAKASEAATKACPNQWAQLVQLMQADKLPKPVSSRNTKKQ
jgi:hypothetical protein